MCVYIYIYIYTNGALKVDPTEHFTFNKNYFHRIYFQRDLLPTTTCHVCDLLSARSTFNESTFNEIYFLMVVGSLGRYRALTRRMHLMLGGLRPPQTPPAMDFWYHTTITKLGVAGVKRRSLQNAAEGSVFCCFGMIAYFLYGCI